MNNGRPRAQKGSAFERQVCTQLSLWWSDGKSDSVFYRTGGSGGRGTRRGRAGKDTINHCGDVQASDPSGMPLMKLCAIELKRGYSKFTIHDILDAPERKGAKKPVQKWQEWFNQAEESAKHAKAIGWMVIARRDGRSSVVFMNESVALCLFALRDDSDMAPCFVVYPSQGAEAVYGMRFADFLAMVKPADVLAVV